MGACTRPRAQPYRCCCWSRPHISCRDAMSGVNALEMFRRPVLGVAHGSTRDGELLQMHLRRHRSPCLMGGPLSARHAKHHISLNRRTESKYGSATWRVLPHRHRSSPLARLQHWTTQERLHDRNQYLPMSSRHADGDGLPCKLIRSWVRVSVCPPGALSPAARERESQPFVRRTHRIHDWKSLSEQPRDAA